MPLYVYGLNIQMHMHMGIYMFMFVLAEKIEEELRLKRSKSLKGILLGSLRRKEVLRGTLA